MNRTKSNDNLIEFLAPALEIQAAPPPKGARAITWSLITLLCCAIIWACIGKVDIVAIAQGKLIPRQKVKVIQPLESGVVKGIHIQEGQRVQQGQLLISFDPAIAQANYLQAEESLNNIEQQVERKQRLLARISEAYTYTETMRLTAAQFSLLNSEIIQYQNQQAVIAAQIKQLQSELTGAKAKLTQLDKMLPLLEERTQALDALQSNKLVARATYLELKQQTIQHTEQRHVELANIKSLQEAIVANTQEQTSQTSQLINATQLELNELLQQQRSVKQELNKFQFLVQQSNLYAPTAGTVEKLMLSTLGEVVTPAQQLLTIVPTESDLIVEAKLLNKDIGFAYPQQAAEIKIDSFPFTRYGVIKGTVIDVSTDAAEDERLGLYFPVKVKLNAQTIDIDGRTVPLSAGMSVSTEIKTGQRKIIEFLLSPIIQHIDEGARER